MESQQKTDPSADIRLSTRQIQAALALICVLPFLVQSVFFDGGFYYDDAFHLEQCELIDAGQISLSDYVFLAHGEHLIPVWKTMFYCCWSTFGATSSAFHMFVTMFHAVAALLLFAVIRNYVNDVSAVIGGLLWAGAAVGGWDGPFLWIAASHLSVGVTFFLAAMLCLTKIHSEHSYHWAAAMFVSLLLCLFTMGSLIVLTPALLLQYWLFERDKHSSATRKASWLGSFVLPCAVVSLLHLIWVLPAMQKLDRPPTDVFAGIQMLGGGYAASAWNLISSDGNSVVWGRITGAIMIALLLLRAERPAQKLCLLLFVVSFCFSVLAYMARSGWEISHVLTWGRYRYLPTIFWCGVLSVVVDRGVHWLTVERRSLLPWVIATGLILFILSQHRLASEAATVFRQISDEARQAKTPDGRTQASRSSGEQEIGFCAMVSARRGDS